MDLLSEYLFVELSTVLLGLLLLTGLVYWYSIKTFGYWRRRKVPYVQPVPFFGNIKEFLTFRKSQNEVYQELYYKLEGHAFGGIFQARRPTLLIRDPDLIKIVLVKDFQHFQDRGIIVHAERHPLQQHLFNLAGYRWRILRNKLSPTFTSGKMKMMFHVVRECSIRLQNYLYDQASKGEIVEMKDVLAKFSTDVIGTCAFGLQMNAIENPDSEFRKMGRKVFEPSVIKRLKQFTNFFMPDISALLKLDDIDDEVAEFFIKVIKETVDYRIRENVNRNDFLQLLINIKLKQIEEGKTEDKNEKSSSKEISEEDFDLDDGLLAAQVFVFFLAGFETSSTTMSFALHELAVNPDIQRRLQEEIDATLESCGGTITYDAILNMKYMDKVVSETLRKYPPLANLIREVTVPYVIPETNVLLEKGTAIVISAHALHHDPLYFPDPETFDPERFSDENKAKRHHYVYLPFGEGPRNCIGMRFGLIQTKMGLLSLLSKYDFHVCARTELPLAIDPRSFITASYTGTILRITNRD